MTASWKEFWNAEHKIYVSDRHVSAYYERLGTDVLSRLPVERPLTLLDWGCGEALLAPRLAESGIDVLLYDPVPRAYARAKERYAGKEHIRVLSDGEYAALPEGSADVIVIHSVLQYVSKSDFERVLPRLHALLRPGGLLLIGDVVPPGLSMFGDAYDLLSAGMRHGFFFDAVGGLFATLFSDYRSIREANGFSMYTEGEMLEVLGRHGLRAERLIPNMGFSRHRMLFAAKRVSN